MTALSIRCEPLNRSAPWTTRWPIAWMSERLEMPGMLRLGRGDPGDDVGQRRLVVAQRHRALDGRVVADLEGDDRLAADPFDQPLGQLPVAVLLDQVGVGFDDLELEGRTAAVEDEYVHDRTLRGQMSDPYSNRIDRFPIESIDYTHGHLCRSRFP